MDINKLMLGLQHLGLPTNDIEQTILFYQKLGFSIAYETVNNGTKVAFLKLQNIVIETYENNRAAMQNGAWDHLAIDVSDIEEAYQFAKENAFHICEDEIQELPFWDNGVRYFNIKGPNAETVEFSQFL